MPSLRSLLALTLLALIGAGCQSSDAPAPTADSDDVNPLLSEWDTPFGVPPFDQIEDQHFLPAMREAMAEHRSEIDAIVASDEAPTFENTIEAIERSGATLGRVASVFFALNSAHSNDAIREAARTLAPELSAHRDDIALDGDLYARVQAVYDQRDALELTPEGRRLLEETHKTFVRSGANLDEASQARLREINGELAQLSQAFGQNLLAQTNDFEIHVTDEADLGGLPASLVAAAAEEAGRRGHEGGWSFTLARPSINPFLQYSPNRELRRQLFEGYAQRANNGGEHDNKETLARAANLRQERAQLMGYETHAHFVLSDNVAETPERVFDLLDQVWPAALELAKRERADMEAMMRAEGAGDDFEGWDWRYYSEKVRRERYALDEEALRPYFEVNAVRDGAFLLATKLFGLQFEPLEDLPRWHPDQQVFEVLEADGSHLGVMYLDFFARPSKGGGAWANSLRDQSRLDGLVHPVVTTNFNFPAPAEGQPSLLAFSDAQTLFHELGHALHDLLSDVTYRSLAGTSVPRDFVEFPSQVMENWMSSPEVLALYAKHYETGEPIPAELIEKIAASGKFNQGFATVEYLAASYLDMAWHTLSAPNELPSDTFEQQEMARIGLIDEIVPRYRSTYFSHIFAGGYSSGYYSYLWSEVLDADAFEAFRETSIFDQDTAQRFRRLLAQGGTRPGMELYTEFRGREPVIDPLLERRGLTGP